MNRRRRSILPLSLGLGMLGVVVAAGLSPNAGVVRAASNCTYGQCVASQPFPLWAVASSVAAVVVALLLALLLLRRRRRPGQPPSEWQGPGDAPGGSGGGAGGEGYQAVGTGAAAALPATAAAGGGAAWQEDTAPSTPAPSTASAPPEPMAGTEPEYLETPAAPVPAPPPPAPASLPPTGRPAAATAAAATPAEPATEEAEPDIDSLMEELEKISGEILKQKPKKGSGGSSTPASDDSSP